MALKQDGFSLGKKRLATGRGHGKFAFFLLKILKREKATVPLFICDRMLTHAHTGTCADKL